MHGEADRSVRWRLWSIEGRKFVHPSAPLARLQNTGPLPYQSRGWREARVLFNIDAIARCLGVETTCWFRSPDRWAPRGLRKQWASVVDSATLNVLFQHIDAQEFRRLRLELLQLPIRLPLQIMTRNDALPQQLTKGSNWMSQLKKIRQLQIKVYGLGAVEVQAGRPDGGCWRVLSQMCMSQTNEKTVPKNKRALDPWHQEVVKNPIR